MLLQIRDFIKASGIASTQQLTRAFKLEKSALQPMLDFWVSKGLIMPCETEKLCQSGCGSACQSNGPRYYSFPSPLEGRRCHEVTDEGS